MSLDLSFFKLISFFFPNILLLLQAHPPQYTSNACVTEYARTHAFHVRTHASTHACMRILPFGPCLIVTAAICSLNIPGLGIGIQSSLAMHLHFCKLAMTLYAALAALPCTVTTDPFQALRCIRIRSVVLPWLQVNSESTLRLIDQDRSRAAHAAYTAAWPACNFRRLQMSRARARDL